MFRLIQSVKLPLGRFVLNRREVPESKIQYKGTLIKKVRVIIITCIELFKKIWNKGNSTKTK